MDILFSSFLFTFGKKWGVSLKISSSKLSSLFFKSFEIKLLLSIFFVFLKFDELSILQEILNIIFSLFKGFIFENISSLLFLFIFSEFIFFNNNSLCSFGFSKKSF